MFYNSYDLLAVFVVCGLIAGAVWAKGDTRA